MSKHALAHTSKGEAARLVKEREFAEQNPLLLIPSKAAAAVNFFIGCNAHLNKPGFELSVAFRVRYWLESEGLSVEGLKKAFKRVCRPDRQGRQEHLGALMADLSAAVDEILKEEKRKTAEREFNAAAKAAAATAAPAAEVRRILAQARRDDPCKTIPSATSAAATA